MKKLKKQYKATITRYNFNEPYFATVKVYNKDPAEKQLEDLLKETNEKYEKYKDSETRIHVTEYWQVVNV